MSSRRFCQLLLLVMCVSCAEQSQEAPIQTTNNKATFKPTTEPQSKPAEAVNDAAKSEPASKEDLHFTAEEVDAHQTYSSQIAEQSARCLEGIWSDHNAFYEKWKVSKYYGGNNESLKTKEARASILKKAGAPADLISQLEPTSCIGMTMRCLEEGFLSVKDPQLESAWKKIKKYVKDRDTKGTDLVDALQVIGWKIYYWNPKPEDNALWDEEDKRLDPDNSSRVWGYHAYRYNSVMKKNLYFRNKVDDKKLLVGFGTEPPQAFVKMPFFIGVAHTGYHVFPGSFGKVIEAHSTRALTSIDNLQSSPFNPIAPQGGPRWTQKEKYRSGIVVVPP